MRAWSRAKVTAMATFRARFDSSLNPTGLLARAAYKIIILCS